MKKLFALLLAVLMVVSLFAGCSKAPEAADSNKPAAEDSNKPAAEDSNAPAEKPKLSISYCSTTDYNNYAKENDKGNYPALRALVDGAGVEVTWRPINGTGYTEAVNTELAAGFDLADIYCDTYGGAFDAAALLENGVTIDLLPLIKEHAPNLMALLEEYPEIMARFTDAEGRLHSFPVTIGDPKDNLPMIALREDWLKELNLEMPTTLDELTAVLTAFRNNDPNGNGVADEVPVTMRWWWFTQYLWPTFGLNANPNELVSLDENGTPQLEILTDNYKAWVEYIHMLYENELIDRNVFTPQDMESRVAELLNNEESTMGGFSWWSTSVAYAFTSTYLRQFDSDASMAILPMLTSEWCDAPVQNMTSALNGAGVITASCKDPVAAIKFIDYCFSEEATMLNVYGVRGETYELDENGNPYYLDSYLAIEDTASWSKIEGYGMVRGIFGKYTTILVSPDKEYNDTIRRDIDAVASRANGVPFPSSLPLTSEQTMLKEQLTLDLNTFIDENLMKFIIGTRDLAEWDDFVTELKEDYQIERLLEEVYKPGYAAYLEKVSLG